METKRKRKARPEGRRNAVIVRLRGDTPNDALARTLTRPETQAAATMQMWEDN